MGQATRRIQRHKKARMKLAELVNNPEHVIVIHYSCGSFYDRPDGSSPRITSIAVRNLESAQTTSFSIHQVAEINGYSLDEVEQHYDQLEKQMLDQFYDYVRSHSGYTWLHWNMRDINYGFRAIAHRYRVLGGQPVEIHDSDKVDLARHLYAIYGRHYMDHPRLQNLVEKNEMSHREFLPGAEEAVAFENKEYVKLHLSTLRKVNILTSIIQLADEGMLKTNSTWKDTYGLYPQAIGEWLRDNWLAALILAIVSIVALVLELLK